MVKQRIAALVRRWADRLDPPPAPIVAMFSPEQQAFLRADVPPLTESVPDRQDRFRVIAEGKRVLYDGPRGAEASRRFLNEKRNNIPVEFFHNAVLRDWWPR